MAAVADPGVRILVPDLVNLMVQEASHLARRLGFRVDTVVLTPNPAPVEGRVVRQDPQPGKKLRRGRTVTLYLEFPQRRPRRKADSPTDEHSLPEPSGRRPAGTQHVGPRIRPAAMRRC
jgi:PASTA domain